MVQMVQMASFNLHVPFYWLLCHVEVLSVGSSGILARDSSNESTGLFWFCFKL